MVLLELAHGLAQLPGGQLVRRRQRGTARLAVRVNHVRAGRQLVAHHRVDALAALLAQHHDLAVDGQVEVGQIEQVGRLHVLAVLLERRENLHLGDRLRVARLALGQRGRVRFQRNQLAEALRLAVVFRERVLVAELEVREQRLKRLEQVLVVQRHHSGGKAGGCRGHRIGRHMLYPFLIVRSSPSPPASPAAADPP